MTFVALVHVPILYRFIILGREGLGLYKQPVILPVFTQDGGRVKMSASSTHFDETCRRLTYIKEKAGNKKRLRLVIN